MGRKCEMGLPAGEFTLTMPLILVVERWQSGLTRTPGKWIMAFALIRTHEESSILTVIFSILGLIKKGLIWTQKDPKNGKQYQIAVSDFPL
jgi:hypothetical protein